MYGFVQSRRFEWDRVGMENYRAKMRPNFEWKTSLKWAGDTQVEM